jgi:protein TonB
LVRALVLSLVFHLFLFWPDLAMREPATPAAPLVASLRPAAAEVTPAVAPADAAPPAKPKIVTAPKPNAPPLPETPSRDTSAEPVPAPAAEISAPAAAPPRAVITSALPPTAGLDPDGLRAFRIALAVEAQRFKRYPARAVEGGWIGTVELRVSLAPGQSLPLVQVSKSSGHQLLDDAALEMVRKALPMTPVPASLRGQAFVVDLPVVFNLE